MKLLVAAAVLALLGGQAAAQCLDHVKVTRSDGSWRVYAGADTADPWVCVGSDNGTPVKSILNIWPIGVSFPDPRATQVNGGLDQLKTQIGAVVTGPVGTIGHWTRLDVGNHYFEAPSFALVHEADEVLMVGGRPYYTFRLRLIGSGAGRSAFDVTFWFDRSLLIALKRANGHAQGTYDIVSIDAN